MASLTLDTSNSSSPENDPETNPSPNPSSSRAMIPNPSNRCLAAECLYEFVENSVYGALAGYTLGYAKGLIHGEGFIGSLVAAGSDGKKFAVWHGIESSVRRYLKRMRGTDDVITHGIAGCCAGLALSSLDAPQELLYSCLGYGAVNIIVKALLNQQVALAHSFSTRNKSGNSKGPRPMALPLSLPLPEELKGAFSSFCKSLVNPNEGRFPTAN
ncbi:hypothetical protein CCACVL1_11288 [Corchorus capsularis]|uniref:Mitochondrial inner membrane translocase subunit Tim17/Tim22/Tim23/peroxisomal protein PMP24 n=1 Tax=Corchorus capsularis TaxID=210143 RepID=A0A1R3IM71_COCAP|nr:hypothetical protein CCACVL1_11288 [Corchorus capsularis]